MRGRCFPAGEGLRRSRSRARAARRRRLAAAAVSRTRARARTPESAAGKNLEMTVPVVITVHLHSLEECTFQSRFGVSFYQGPAGGGRRGDAAAAEPPAPTCSDVELRTVPAHDIISKHFGGWAWSREVKRQGCAFLRDAITLYGEDVADDVFFVAVYNSPWQLWNRRNEIWLLRHHPSKKHASGRRGAEPRPAAA